MLNATPLRVKLIGVILVLLTIALALIGIGSVSIMRGYLIDRVDSQIDMTVDSALRRMNNRNSVALMGKTMPSDARLELRGKNGRTLVLLSGIDVEGKPGPNMPPARAPTRSRTVTGGSG